MLQVHLWVFTARKRSLGQGNVFTGVCLSTGEVPGPEGVEGVPAPGRGACSGGGVPAPGGLVWGVPGGDPPDGYCCGRYASYWNAFLFLYWIIGLISRIR